MSLCSDRRDRSLVRSVCCGVALVLVLLFRQMVRQLACDVNEAEEAEQRRPYGPEGRVPPKIRRAARGGKGGGQRKGGGDAAAVAAEQRLLARNHVRMKNFLRKRGQPTCNAAGLEPLLAHAPPGSLRP